MTNDERRTKPKAPTTKNRGRRAWSIDHSSFVRPSSLGNSSFFSCDLARAIDLSTVITTRNHPNRHEASRSVRHSQFLADLSLLHRRLHLHLAHFRRKR